MRRVVTGHDAQGRSIVASDGTPPRTHHFKGWPGFVNALGWSTEASVPVTRAGEDPTGKVATMIPDPGSTRLILLTLPPDSTMASADFDGALYGTEQATHNPGLAETFDADGMHTTPTIDYIFVLKGEVWLRLDDSAETHLQTGDVVVQNATRHGWSNRTDQPAELACVLIGAAGER
jgi:cupin domain